MQSIKGGGTMHDNQCYEQLKVLDEKINKELGYSYDNLKKLKDESLFDSLIEKNNIDIYLKKDFNAFMDILFNNMLDEFPYLKKIFLHESNYVQIFSAFGYETSLYINNLDAYRFFPRHVKSCMDKFNLENYKNLSYDEIEYKLKKYMDIYYYFDLNAKRNLAEVINRYPNLYTDYSKGEEKIINNTLNINDPVEFFIWSEYYTYINEYYELSKYKIYNPNCLVRWVSKNHGDGYGFDILSYDPILKRQKLIEVKSSKYDNYNLNLLEYKVSMKISDKCDYYVYEYHQDENHNISLIKLKYEKEKKLFIDATNNENIYHTSPYFCFDKNGVQKVLFSIESKKELK